MGKKFLWCMVNYKTEIYLRWQLRSAYEFNNTDDFDFLIVDNNPVHDTEYWEKLKEEFPGLVVIPHDPVDVNRTSGEHGQGLDIALNYAREGNYEYFLANDPDFFWVQKNILNYFDTEFKERGVVGIGAPYTIPLQHFDFNTPCLFGCVYTMKFLEGLSLACDKDQHQVVIGGKDVGWEIRQKLASSPAYKLLTFQQADVKEKDFVGGSHQKGMHYSFQALLKEYTLFNKKIAYHLHRGSFADHLDNYSKENWRSDRTTDLKPPPDLWTQTREAYCEKYYLELLNSGGMM